MNIYSLYTIFVFKNINDWQMWVEGWLQRIATSKISGFVATDMGKRTDYLIDISITIKCT